MLCPSDELADVGAQSEGLWCPGSQVCERGGHGGHGDERKAASEGHAFVLRAHLVCLPVSLPSSPPVPFQVTSELQDGERST